MKTVDLVLDGRTAPMRVKAKTFRTGSRGYYVWGKAEDPEGTRYQVICSLVEIGSRPSP